MPARLWRAAGAGPGTHTITRRRNSGEAARRPGATTHGARLAAASGGNLTPVLKRARAFASLVARGNAPVALQLVATRLHSHTRFYGLRHDLHEPTVVPAARINVDIRPLANGDDLSFLEPDPTLDRNLNWVRQEQRRLVDARIPTCWVAVAEGNRIAYMQWLIGPSQNRRIQARWGGLFPQLAPNEALLEGAYTPEDFRGMGIMPHAMARITEAARELDVRYVITFVKEDNIPALKGCKKSGYTPHLERRHDWFMLRRRVAFAPLPPGTPFPFDQTG